MVFDYDALWPLIEIFATGVPFSDPIGDGPTIQSANQHVLEHGFCSLGQCLNLVRTARARGLTVPLVFMGYLNTFFKYGEGKSVQDCVAAGIDGFIVVDLPPEESSLFAKTCYSLNVALVPLVTPLSTDERIKFVSELANCYIYVVSMQGVTGQNLNNSSLPAFIERIRSHTSLPLAIGFGVSNSDHFRTCADVAEGVIIGSAIIKSIMGAGFLTILLPTLPDLTPT